MGWFTKSEKEKLLEKIRDSKYVKKSDFIYWLSQNRVIYNKSTSWDELIPDLKESKKIGIRKLENFLKSRIEEDRKVKLERKKKQSEKLKDVLEKGGEFEKVVAKWAKRKFQAEKSTNNELVKGKTSKRPYEIDVHLFIDGGYWKNDRHIWIECKNRKSSIKRTDMHQFKEKAEDIKDAYESDIEDFCFDELVYVSTSKFDGDALGYARKHDIQCFQYSDRKFIEVA
ncbi:MAG: hypothetical protein JSW60_01145 [Thermoplasmatales archaeon]|nr:MAG: hypothetical protein JSW60_01145 [Thermoplasmatales archaeon]